jgi:putative membrane protein
MFIDSFLSFGLFFLTAIGVLVLFLYLYALVTPYDDYKLIFKENNSAAAIGFGGAILGLCIPLYSALINSAFYVDFLIWAAVAMSVQLVFAFVIIRLNAKFSFEKQIENGVISVSVLMAFLSISIGLLNAGSMSY